MTSLAFSSNQRLLKKMALGSTALSIAMLMATSAAIAATAPTSGSLPGSFSTNTTGTTYTGTGSTATISIGTGTTVTGQVLQFGGAALTNPVAPMDGTAPLASATNSGFSIGSGASLTLTGGVAVPTLVNDQTGSPSQIYGSLNASGLGGPLFVANANGVVVGSTGTITAPADGAGLLGYAADSNSFAGAGTLTVNSATIGNGSVTVANGATTSGSLLIASNGAVNVGTGAGATILAGYGFTTGATGGATAGSALPLSTATVSFTGGTTTTPFTVATLDAAGAVNNSGVLNLSTGSLALGGDLNNTGILTDTASLTVGGTFTNNGQATVGDLTAAAINNAGVLTETGHYLYTTGKAGATSGADITNTGVINESASYLDITAGSHSGASGNFSNTGTINFTTASSSSNYGTDGLYVEAANINLAGKVQATPYGATAPAALSATNYLSYLYLYSGYDYSSATSAYTGVVDVASSIYTNNSYIDAGAARILSGGLYGAGDYSYAEFYLGNGSFADPFTNTTLSYNLSLFPKTTVSAGEIYVGGYYNPNNSYPNINLNGVLSTQVTPPTPGDSYNSISLTDVHNVNGSGGFALANDGFLDIYGFTGNINNPNGAASAGSTAFQYNNVPVNVSNTSTGGLGTANIYLHQEPTYYPGPTSSSGTAQNVNFLVNGNVNLYNDGPSTPSLPATPAASYTNNHLVVQATGNIAVGDYTYSDGSSYTSSFYWPGLVYLSTVTSATNPLALSTTGSVTLDGNLSNVIPAVVSGGGGIFFETNNLNLNGYTVTTNTNSWVNFATAQIASAFATVTPASFKDVYLNQITPTVSELDQQTLPLAYFQPAS